MENSTSLSGDNPGRSSGNIWKLTYNRNRGKIRRSFSMSSNM
jgi:hypothetical protein